MEIVLLIGLYIIIIIALFTIFYIKKEVQKEFSNFNNSIQNLILTFEKQKEEQEFLDFSPYLVYTKKEEPTYTNDFTPTGRLLKKNGFYSIIFEKDEYGLLFGSEEWVKLEELEKNPPKMQHQIPTRVSKDYVSLYNGPGKGYLELGKLKKGTPVEILDKVSIWKKIKIPNGIIGFIWEEYLEN